MSISQILLLLLSCLAIQAFFAMMEMAIVSFNKVRLHYYVSQGGLRAKWLAALLRRPIVLFGTTLIGVNGALQLGSEAGRQLFIALDITPEFALITQGLLVLIFAELAPMFAGRRYAEHVAMIGIPVLYFFSLLLRPAIYILDLLSQAIHRFVGGKRLSESFLSRDELEKALEELTDQSTEKEGVMQTVVSRIFTLRSKTALSCMRPLLKVQMIPSVCTIGEMRQLLQEKYTPYLPVYHQQFENVVAIAYPRDLLRLSDDKRVRDFSRSAWFVIGSTPLLDILKQFRRNSQSLAIVLDPNGIAQGILTLDDIIDEIFESYGKQMPWRDVSFEKRAVVVDRTLSGDLSAGEFNRLFKVVLPCDEEETLEEIVAKELGHAPTKGESVRIGEFELKVVESPLIGPKSIAVHSID